MINISELKNIKEIKTSDRMFNLGEAVEITRETEKAIAILKDRNGLGPDREIWIPKSQLRIQTVKNMYPNLWVSFWMKSEKKLN